jgi:hypothetical protein
MPRSAHPIAIAPTWSEMDAFLDERSGWQRRAVVGQRALDSRWGETLVLEWGDVDIHARAVTFRPEITKGGYGGRRTPVPALLVAELEGWSIRQGRVVGAPGPHLDPKVALKLAEIARLIPAPGGSGELRMHGATCVRRTERAPAEDEG